MEQADKGQQVERPGKQSDLRVSIDRQYGPVSEVFAALASPLRSAIVHRLTVREHTVAELVDALGAAQPLVSQHLSPTPRRAR